MAMRDGTCPNCGSNEILVSTAPDVNLTANEPTWKALFSYIGRTIPVGSKKAISVKHYTCTACHLLESYIATEAGMNLAKQAWTPLNQDDNTKEK